MSFETTGEMTSGLPDMPERRFFPNPLQGAMVDIFWHNPELKELGDAIDPALGEMPAKEVFLTAGFMIRGAEHYGIADQLTTLGIPGSADYDVDIHHEAQRFKIGLSDMFARSPALRGAMEADIEACALWEAAMRLDRDDKTAKTYARLACDALAREQLRRQEKAYRSSS